MGDFPKSGHIQRSLFMLIYSNGFKFELVVLNYKCGF